MIVHALFVSKLYSNVWIPFVSVSLIFNEDLWIIKGSVYKGFSSGYSDGYAVKCAGLNNN